MNTQFKKYILGLSAVAVLSVSANAQDYTSYIRTLNVDNFSNVSVDLDTEVILIKSDSNRVTLAGDSSLIFSKEITVEDGTLTFGYEKEPENKLFRVVIEYTDLDRLVAGGEGIYYLYKMDLDNLVVFNPEAQLFASGAVNKIRLISNEGFNDISKLQASNKFLHIGETATLVSADEDAELFVASNNE